MRFLKIPDVKFWVIFILPRMWSQLIKKLFMELDVMMPSHYKMIYIIETPQLEQILSLFFYYLWLLKEPFKRAKELCSCLHSSISVVIYIYHSLKNFRTPSNVQKFKNIFSICNISWKTIVHRRFIQKIVTWNLKTWKFSNTKYSQNTIHVWQRW